ncbi:acyloxyacyl hydrolase [Halomonas sp. DN3]|uniref:acyloxyacyl hydrolase n=1 Tax=Halomonas sp. DN3 TaxID=2953657 RepID=UPI0020A132E7|nr:acyloxyacyl hydrolase [Halomonas sp. DN3]USZ49882.1 acyloxyacyl hydrolase [Halomonas sp. DN3]
MPTSLARPLACCLLMGLASTATAGPTLGLGSTSEGTGALDLGYDWTFDLSRYHPSLDLRLGTGVILFEGDDRSDNQAFYLRPALRYSWDHVFVEGGIGASAFIDTHIEDRDLGSSFQFEDRLALGLRMGPYGDLSISATHYSNASIKEPNDGFELYALNWRLAY